MDDFLHAIWFDKPFTLSNEEDSVPIVISPEVLKFCQRHDIYVLNYLYQGYKKHLNGVIINTVEDMNPQLQISVFLGALKNALKTNFLVLVLCPEDTIIKWHYYMSWCGVFNIKIITPESALDDINEETGMVLLLSFSNIKMVEALLEYYFISVVIDRCDEVATKLVIRKLQATKFNIGVTHRNFYTDPDQKLQWSMLNWAHPGCVRKLADFYALDNESFKRAYEVWWFTIMWDYREFFKLSWQRKGRKLARRMRRWAKLHYLFKYSLLDSSKTAQKDDGQRFDNSVSPNSIPKKAKIVSPEDEKTETVNKTMAESSQNQANILN